MTNYLEFLKSKIEIAPASGFDVDPAQIHPALKPHQRDAVVWALQGGRRAIFASFGLGKSLIQLEFCRQITTHIGGKALIVLPLGVRQEFTHDAVNLLGMEAPPYVRNMAEVMESSADIFITNYERVRDGDIDPKYFAATSLDEAAVLRWDDINRMKTLNTNQIRRRQQLHVCPLQIDIVDRIINRYSNPGDLVMDPFGGIGTVALQAIKSGRRGYTIELNHDYFRDAVGYLQGFENEISQPTLFDFIFEGATEAI